MSREPSVSFGLILRRQDHPELEVRVGPEHVDPWNWIRETLLGYLNYSSKNMLSALAFVNKPSQDVTGDLNLINQIKRNIENARYQKKWEATAFPAQDQGKLVFAGIHMRRAE